MSNFTILRTNTSILVKINKPNITRLGRIEYIILVSAQIKAPNFEVILKKPLK